MIKSHNDGFFDIDDKFNSNVLLLKSDKIIL
nr:MAG TPA: hypothetical protein [Caudoviricetes sp.]